MIIEQAQRISGVEQYYFSSKLEEIRKLKQSGADVINLGIGSPDLAPSDETITATITALRNQKNHGYSSYRSLPEFRKGLADWYLKTYQVSLDFESEILPLLGSKEAITYITQAFVNAGDRVLIPNPGYPAYASTAKLCGAEIIYYNLKEGEQWLPNFSDLEKCDLSKVKIMWVNYPHMPTGASANSQVFKDLVLFAKKNKILICHDNPYSQVLNPNAPESILKYDPKFECSLELNSFSKAFNMAGWRVGVVCSAKEVIDSILKVKSNVDSGMFAPIQFGAMQALKNSSQWHLQRNAIYEKRRLLVYKIFDALEFDFSKSQVGLFVWAKSRTNKNISLFVDELLKSTHIFMTPGCVFGSQGEPYVRSSLCASEEILEHALKRILNWKH
jgi:LL-diaminopimelate aminotransferase